MSKAKLNIGEVTISQSKRLHSSDCHSVSIASNEREGFLLSRSIGDADLKGCGLTASPEVSEFELSTGDTFLVLASDGLWDKLSSQDAIDLVHDTVKDASMCAQRLVTEALTRGSGRDWTEWCFILDFGRLWLPLWDHLPHDNSQLTAAHEIMKVTAHFCESMIIRKKLTSLL